MSWGYWGIVFGLGLLCLLFFVTMSIVYGRSGTHEAGGREADREASASGPRRAA